MRLDLEEALSTARIESGGTASDIARLRRLAEEAPLRERRWGHLMHALYRAGRQAESLRVFREAAQGVADPLSPRRPVATCVRPNTNPTWT